jgi:hypothetical protein
LAEKGTKDDERTKQMRKVVEFFVAFDDALMEYNGKYFETVETRAANSNVSSMFAPRGSGSGGVSLKKKERDVEENTHVAPKITGMNVVLDQADAKIFRGAIESGKTRLQDLFRGTSVEQWLLDSMDMTVRREHRDTISH